MKSAKIGAVVVAAAALAGGPSPARAATTYTIAGPKVFMSSSTVFTDRGCPEAWVSTPANGVDSRVVNVSSLAGRGVALSWTANTSASSTLGGGLTVDYYTGGCQRNLAARQNFGLTPGSTTLIVPAGAKWAVFDGNWFVDVKITF